MKCCCPHIHSSVNSRLVLDVQVNAEDLDGPSHSHVRYAIVDGNHGSPFTIDPARGELKVAQQLDRERVRGATVALPAASGCSSLPSQCSSLRLPDFGVHSDRGGLGQRRAPPLQHRHDQHRHLGRQRQPAALLPGQLQPDHPGERGAPTPSVGESGGGARGIAWERKQREGLTGRNNGRLREQNFKMSWKREREQR